MPNNNTVKMAIKGWQNSLYLQFIKENYPPQLTAEEAFKKGVEYALRAIIGEKK